MTLGSVHGLTTPRATDWRDTASCREADPELFFPKGDSGPWLLVIEQAKSICQACPVIQECAQAALAGREKTGIWGGMTAQQRKNALKQGRRKRSGDQKPQEPQPASLAEAVNRRCLPADGGHTRWGGVQHLQFQGQRYTAIQASFIVGHGRDPVGHVRRSCEDAKCVRSDHLSDQIIRDAEDRCGSRSGYLRHRKRGEDCERCRQANTDANNRLLRTGTTKAAV